MRAEKDDEFRAGTDDRAKAVSRSADALFGNGSAVRPADDDLEVIYDLRQDRNRVSLMKGLSKDKNRPDLGLSPKPYLIGSRRFWRHLGSARLPLESVEGKISRVLWTGMGDHPSFEVTTDSGAVHSFSRYGDVTRYLWGLRARVELVRMPWKPDVTGTPFLSDRLVTRILVEATAARSDPRCPGPYGPMLASEHQGSRLAWGLRCFEHWLVIENIEHHEIGELVEHLWAWLTVTQDTFNEWHDHPARLVDSGLIGPLRAGLGLDSTVGDLLEQALSDAKGLAYDNLFVGFDHDRHVLFAAALGQLLEPFGIALPNPDVFRLPEAVELPHEWGPIPRNIVASWRSVSIPWPQYSTVSIATSQHISDGANPGDLGVIVELYPNAYEIEVTDSSGRTLFLGAVAHDDVEFRSYAKHTS